MRFRMIAAATAVSVLALTGCGHSQQPVSMAPPVNNGSGGAAPVAAAPPGAQQGGGGVYNWQDVPQNQDVPITRGVFDHGGYQLYADTGETIIIPFANQNLYVMKFGRSNTGQTFFRNEGSVPVLYLRPGDFLSNAAAQNARWYPIPDDFRYERPMYVAVAPSWAEYTALGWYPGMSYYGGMWGYSPGVHFVWMPSFYIGLGGARYTSFTNYRSYYVSHPGYARTTTVFNYSSPRSTGSFGARRSVGTTGSFGRSAASSSSFGRRSGGSTSSFGNRTLSGSTSAFGGSSTGSSGSFGAGRARSSFGGSSSSFGGSRPSFGGGTTSARPSGGSFGGKSSGSSFGGSRPSFGGGSRSSGGSFGRRR